MTPFTKYSVADIGEALPETCEITLDECFLLLAGFLHKCYSSTEPSAERLRLLTKKKKKKSKRYIELLQGMRFDCVRNVAEHHFLSRVILVTKTSSKQTTTEIHKLKAKQLSDFIREESFNPSPVATNALQTNTFAVDAHEMPFESQDSPVVFVGGNVKELSLSDSGLRDIIDSFHAFREVTEIGEATSEEVHDEMAHEEELIEEDFLVDPILPVQEEAVKNVQSRFKGKYHKSIESERLSKQKSLALSLHAYLDCCVQNAMLNRGYATIMNYRIKLSRSTTGIKIIDVKLYNMLMHGFAEKENLPKIKEIMNILREDEIKPNAQTFANYLECLGRISKNPLAMIKHNFAEPKDLVKVISQILHEAASYKQTTNSIVDESIFLKDQREQVIDAIRLAEPDFNPVYTPPNILYHNKILNGLNKHVREMSFDPLSNLDVKIPGSEIMDSKAGFSREELENFGRQQLENELAGYITIKSIQKFPEPTPSVLHCRSKLNELQKNWRETIVNSFNRDFNTMRHLEASKRGSQNLLPYLRALEVDEYASIVLQEIRTLAEGSETYSPTVGQLYRALGVRVQLRYQMEHKKRNGILQKTGEIYGNFCEILATGNSSDNPRQCWQRLVYQRSNEGPSMNFNVSTWPLAVHISVGRFLYNILMRDLKVDANSMRMGKQKVENMTPAFYTLFRHQGKNVKEEVKPHPVLSKLYRGSQQENLTFEVNQVPMLCPPQPWTTSKNGGYLLAKSDLIRLPQSAQQQHDRIENTPPAHLYASLDSLNQLGSIAWTVNQGVLDVILKVFQEGGNEKLEVPPLPSTLPPPPVPDTDAELTKEEKYALFKLKMLHRRKQAEMYSLWCDALYRLSLAHHYRDRVFWLPHNMDFRGRVYPLPPHLQHLGSDLARCLLVFHQNKKLGVDGFSWLKLHCINLTGLKKRDSIRERLLFAEQIMPEILDSADNPLEGHMWWLKSDEPWQTLSCCMEIAKVLRSGDPENFESNFPIHQDGSCNGLQHYAALGRDSAGALSVNLAPAEVPQDVYSGIAALVEQARQRDEEDGIEVARVLRSFVMRKVIKQTVMTTVYGVTRYGARLQIAKQLKDLDEFPKDMVWPASSYLTNKTFESLREMFTSTKEIQDWFTDCARLISSVCGQNVEWITPLGLPVVQPYNRFDKRPVLGKGMKLDASFAMDTYLKPNIMKQKNAFPPNFIHSLDSSHMMLTSLFCEKAGITFISVHDCFWTHPCTVPEMNRICREQFVALHSQPILEDLSKYMINKYKFKQK